MSPQPYYDEGGVTIYHGEAEEILPAVERPSVIVTDPPYGLGALLSGGWGKRWGLHSGRGETWDDSAPSVVSTLPGLADHCIIWGGNYFPLPPARGWLVWDKIVRNFSSGHCELAWTTLDQPVRAFSYSHGQLATEGKFHPTQKPLPLMAWCLSFMPDDLDVVLDPFAGSGSTLVAAKARGHRAIGVEQDERYCEIAAKRLAQGVLDFGAASMKDQVCRIAGDDPGTTPNVAPVD